jgi:alpha-glucosidase (family GH31 glycosyl hydrolase)
VLYQSLISENADHFVAVAAQNYDAFNNGVRDDVFLRKADGSLYKGRVWPGATVFPDWFHSNTQNYWDSEFATFFDANTGMYCSATIIHTMTDLGRCRH